ncbi:MAG: succinate dehydrogenase, cytochrome b556 subunit [Candidatus Omnitrophica bacterium]|nr:succinate dehydrogenase, cytochrome b556 subunit [Candidatus Omnitrophota bacterium]
MTRYRGGTGQWSWMLHRVTGVAVLLFLCAHILDTALIVLGPELYNRIIKLYRLPAFGVMEIGLFAAVLYHALNGVRITAIDVWTDLTRCHQQLFRVQMALFVLIMAPVTVIMLGHIF